MLARSAKNENFTSQKMMLIMRCDFETVGHCILLTLLSEICDSAILLSDALRHGASTGRTQYMQQTRGLYTITRSGNRPIREIGYAHGCVSGAIGEDETKFPFRS